MAVGRHALLYVPLMSYSAANKPWSPILRLQCPWFLILIIAASHQYLSHLCVSSAVVHHVVLGGHVVGLVEFGGVKLHLLDLGDPLGDVDLPEALALALIPPPLEELLEDGSLSALREDLDL